MPELGFYDLVALIARDHPNIAVLLSKPGVLEVMLKVVQAEVDGAAWTDQQITDALQATPYYQTTNAESREWDILQVKDPAQVAQTIDQRSIEIAHWATQAGLGMTNDEAHFIAGISLAGGMNEAQWQQHILERRYSEMVQSGKGGMPILDRLKARAGDYAVPVDDLTLLDWQRQILSGAADENTFDSYLHEQAKSLFPGLANAIDRGITVKQYVQPYAAVAGQELGVNSADIDWRDPKWSTAIHQIDPKTGNPVSMSLSDWTAKLRTDSVYGFNDTQRGQEQASALGRSLAETLGRAA